MGELGKEIKRKGRKDAGDIYNKWQGIKILNIEKVLTKEKKKCPLSIFFFFQTINSHNQRETKVANPPIWQKLTSLVQFFFF